MENTFNSLTAKIANRQIHNQEEILLEKFGLAFNPFPRSGISDLNSSDELIARLAPVDENVKEEIDQYVVDSLLPENPLTPEDKYMSAVIRGDYGYGKTQTLLYIKVLLESFSTRTDVHKNPYVIYIQNPGAKLTELIGSIISQIGEENFKKYLWNKIISNILSDQNFKDEISITIKGGDSLFNQDNPINPFTPENTINFKKFLDTLYKVAKNQKELQEKIRDFTLKILTPVFDNLTVANYFYEFLLESAGISKTWENLTAGTSKSLDKKEVNLIKAVIQVVLWQGYTNFYILVDEFEAVAEGRLSKLELERYLSNLRTLIDKERNWCSVFAMTNPAFERVNAVAAPLAQRLSSRSNINLAPLNNETARKLVTNYLNLSRSESDSIAPFDESGIERLREITRGIHRLFLKACYTLVQRAGERLETNQLINKTFVNQFIEEEFE